MYHNCAESARSFMLQPTIDFRRFKVSQFFLFLVASLTVYPEKKKCQRRIDDATIGIKTDHLTVLQQYRPVSADFTKLSGGLGLTSMFANNDNEKPSANNNVLLITCE